MAISNFTVEVTPLKSATEYSNAIDITDFVQDGGIGKISQSIDSGDYDIGLYTYADLNLTLINYDGRFNDERDSASIFFYTRDRAKINITYNNEAGTQTLVFKGIINDEATRQDIENGTIRIKVLSQDSILRKTKVAGGVLNNSTLISAAIKTLLNRPAITSVLGYDASKITVGTDQTIDDVTSFTEKDTRFVLDKLLNASGSVFSIDSSNDMVVSDRDVKAGSALELYGGGDFLGRDNIISLKKYNDGLHRTFNTVTVNDTTADDSNFIDRYGARIKNLDFDFITNSSTASAIATYLLGQFKAPKAELEITVPVDVAKSVEALDPVTVEYVKQYAKWLGVNRVPVAGVAVAGTDIAPYTAGGFTISSGRSWKVTGIIHDPKKFETTLRLREV